MEAISPRNFKTANWSTMIMFALGFWLSGSFIFDFLVVPGMLTSGMMNEPGFASAGYMIFGAFNHVEILCGAVALAGCLVYRYGWGLTNIVNAKSIGLASILLAIALVYTYILTPEMSGLGLPLDISGVTEHNTQTMGAMHLIYWGLEITKLLTASALLKIFYRNSCSIA